MVLPGRVPEDEAVEKFRVDEPELGNPELDKPLLDKLEVGLTLIRSLEELVSSLVVPLRMKVSLIPVFGFERSGFDCYSFDFG
nr:hypothetical protein [Tanacetum cinerariifolium]